MSLNNCIICSKWYREDEDHPCICPDCQEEIDNEEKDV